MTFLERCLLHFEADRLEPCLFNHLAANLSLALIDGVTAVQDQADDATRVSFLGQLNCDGPQKLGAAYDSPGYGRRPA